MELNCTGKEELKLLSENFLKDRGEAIKSHSIKTDEIELHYELYRGVLTAENRSCFSVAVNCIFNGENDTSFAYDISSLRDSAESVFDQLCSGMVTPCTLFDVLENLL